MPMEIVYVLLSVSQAHGNAELSQIPAVILPQETALEAKCAETAITPVLIV